MSRSLREKNKTKQKLISFIFQTVWAGAHMTARCVEKDRRGRTFK